MTTGLGSASPKTSSFLTDPNTSYAQVLAQHDSDGEDARWVWEESLAPLTMTRGGRTFFYLADGQDSVRQLTDESGRVTDSYHYDAWGNPLAGGSGTTKNPFRYTGQQMDQDGKYFLRARYYNSGTGRFLSQDPEMGSQSDPISLHRYLYAGDDAINGSDPSGRETLGGMMANIAIGKMLGGVGGLEWGLAHGHSGGQMAQDIGYGMALGAVAGASPALGLGIGIYGAIKSFEHAYIVQTSSNYSPTEKAIAWLDAIAIGVSTGSAAAGSIHEHQAQLQEELGSEMAGTISTEEKFSNTEYSSYDEYLAANSPDAKINNLIDKYGLRKHLAGKQVIYGGPKTAVSGGVQPDDPNVIRIYDEGLSFDDRHFVETLIEEIHHSKLMNLYPETRSADFNETWRTVVEPRARAYAKEYGKRIFDR